MRKIPLNFLSKQETKKNPNISIPTDYRFEDMAHQRTLKVFGIRSPLLVRSDKRIREIKGPFHCGRKKMSHVDSAVGF